MDKQTLEKMSQFINDGNYEKAIEVLDEVIQNEPKNYQAIFNRAFMKFVCLNKVDEDVINDFDKVAQSKSELKGKAIACLVIAYSHLENYRAAYLCGKAKDCDYSDFALDYNFAMSRACFFLGNEYLEEALDYINKCLEDENADEFNHYYCKVDILLELGRFDEASQLLDDMYSRFGASFNYYYDRARINLELYNRDENKDPHYLEEAEASILVAKKYEDKNISIELLHIEVLMNMKKAKESLEILETIKNELKEEEYIINKLKIYQAIDDIDSIITTAKEYLKTNDSPFINSYVGATYQDNAKSNEDLKEALPYYKHAYELSPNYTTFIRLYNINYLLHLNSDNLELIRDYNKKAEDRNDTLNCLATTKYRLNRPYDEIESAYMKNGTKNGVDYLKFISIISMIDVNPKRFYRYFKKYKKIPLEKIETWNYKKLGFMFLFGENGLSVNYDRAKEFLLASYNDDPDESCNISALARFYEVTGNNEEAFKLYKEAYLKRINYFAAQCVCSDGYMAHAYLNGIGTKVDEEKAKEITLNAFNFLKKTCNNTIIYLYTFFALQGDERFNLETAEEYLQLTFPFERYEITRYMMLKRVKEALNKPTVDVEREIKKCLPFTTKIAKDFYNEHKDDKIIYISPDCL
ncbi:MAG: hypothetical protein PUH11_06940 [Bacilli bacterium]|nr:hypothetical protein [Bacilli bacterium]MDD7315443.1 hypothetical protein [Bacilli bacterium]MDY4053101.1 hypothetical protein [Bacilli bacterium]